MSAGELGMWEWEIATNRMIYSDRARAIYGFPLNVELTYDDVRRHTHPEDLPFTSAQAARSLDPEIRERNPYEYRVVWPNGEIRWVLAYGQAVFEQANGALRATRYIGTIQDITARKQMEQDLRAAATRLSLALTAGRMAVWEIDDKGVLKVSPELNRMLGFGPEEQPDIEDVRARYFPGELERLRSEAHARLAAGEHSFDAEFRYLWPDQSVRWLWVRAEVNPPGMPYAAIGVVQDVTDRKLREQHVESLLHELSHRSKNLLAVLQAVTRQTVRTAESPAQFERAMLGRVQALASAHDLLLQEDWRGADISDIITSQLQAFAKPDRKRVDISGPPALLHSNAAQDLSISMYELATNALKYGALSTPEGRISISWIIEQEPGGPRKLRICWRESGGPQVTAPTRRGFGSTVLGRGGEKNAARGPLIEFHPDGVRWIREWVEPEFSVLPPMPA